MTQQTAKKISIIVMAIFYIGAGINHFIRPAGYLSIIPPYISQHEMINHISGICEIIGGVLLLFNDTRRFAAWGIIAMLIAFIPAHIYMVQKGGCMGPQICIPAWLAWVRLVVLQPLFIWWAWKIRNQDLGIRKT